MHDVIYDELVLGVVRDESRAAYVDVVQRLVDRGAGGVVLGCTEIELLIGPDDVDVPVFATTALHARAAVDFALELIQRTTRSSQSSSRSSWSGPPNISGLPGGGR